MADLDDLIATLDARVQDALDDVAAEVRAKARAGAPSRSGRLQRSIVVQRVSSVERSVFSPLPYAPIEEEREGFFAAAERAVEPMIQGIFDRAMA